MIHTVCRKLNSTYWHWHWHWEKIGLDWVTFWFFDLSENELNWLSISQIRVDCINKSVFIVRLKLIKCVKTVPLFTLSINGSLNSKWHDISRDISHRSPVLSPTSWREGHGGGRRGERSAGWWGTQWGLRWGPPIVGSWGGWRWAAARRREGERRGIAEWKGVDLVQRWHILEVAERGLW